MHFCENMKIMSSVANVVWISFRPIHIFGNQTFVAWAYEGNFIVNFCENMKTMSSVVNIIIIFVAVWRWIRFVTTALSQATKASSAHTLQIIHDAFHAIAYVKIQMTIMNYVQIVRSCQSTLWTRIQFEALLWWQIWNLQRRQTFIWWMGRIY